MSEYDDLDNEVRPHLTIWVRGVIQCDYSYYPEEVDFWPRTLVYFRHREAFYVGVVRLYSHPETAKKWELSETELAEFTRIRQGPTDDLFALAINNIEIKCGAG